MSNLTPALSLPTRRPWALYLAIFLVLLGAISNTIYLFNHCPIDLSEDESHYWLWSQHLDYGYYSKPPGIAWVLAGAQKIGEFLQLTGDGSGMALMPVLRMPAVIFGCCSGLLSLLLARRMFRDDRAALAVTVLSAAVPMFAVGSLLITIDSPMYLCWALTVVCLWRHIDANAKEFTEVDTGKLKSVRWVYLAGVACAIGMLFKPVLIAIPVCVLVAAWIDPFAKRSFKTVHSIGALIVMLLSQVPVIVWNANHGWVTFKHIGTQGGFVGGALDLAASQPTTQLAHHPNTLIELAKTIAQPFLRVLSYVGGQAGAMGVLPFLLLSAVIVIAIRITRRPPTERAAASESPDAAFTSQQQRSVLKFLLAFTLPLWGFYFVMNLWKGTEVNWPAASYFTGMILNGGIVANRWNFPLGSRVRRHWRFWVTTTVAAGFCMTTIAMNFQRLYPLAAKHLPGPMGSAVYMSNRLHPHNWDVPTMRLRGLAERAQRIDALVEDLRAKTGKEPILLSNRYDMASSLTFYMKGHPFVYCIGSSIGERHSQYDLWPSVNDTGSDGKTLLAGRPALIIGSIDKGWIAPVIAPSFGRLDTPPQRVPIIVNGIQIKDVPVYTGYDFHGLPISSNNKY